MNPSPTAPQATAAPQVPQVVAVIQDISGLGRCSLAAALPVLAALGVQACPVPTAVLTSQTGFRRFALCDCTSVLTEFPAVWQALGVTLDGICTGFMGNLAQLNAARALIEALRPPLLLIDPVLGDGGALYPCFDEAYLQAMRDFIAPADVLTPNVTEACLLCGVNYAQFAAQSEPNQLQMLARICESLPAKVVVITGWAPGQSKDTIATFVYNKAPAAVKTSKAPAAVKIYKKPRIGGSYSGTGDLFAACLCGYLLRKTPVETAIPQILAFLEASLRSAQALARPPEEGVPFELHLDMLTAQSIVPSKETS